MTTFYDYLYMKPFKGRVHCLVSMESSNRMLTYTALILAVSTTLGFSKAGQSLL